MHAAVTSGYDAKVWLHFNYNYDDIEQQQLNQPETKSGCILFTGHLAEEPQYNSCWFNFMRFQYKFQRQLNSQMDVVKMLSGLFVILYILLENEAVLAQQG